MSAFSNNSISRYVPSFGIGYSFFRGFLPPFFEARIFASSDPTTFGNLSTIAAVTQTGAFSVRDYTSSGYVVQMIGATPAYNGHHLTAITPASCSGTTYGCASSSGSEQFGVNVWSNTSPTNPVPGSSAPVCQAATFCSGQAGDVSFGGGGTTCGPFGSANRPYCVDGRYLYASGDTIASGSQSSGETDYTMTFLANISTLTPSGTYTGNLTLVATGSY